MYWTPYDSLGVFPTFPDWQEGGTYGVNFGPRLSDLQLDQVMDLILTIRAGA